MYLDRTININHWCIQCVFMAALLLFIRYSSWTDAGCIFEMPQHNCFSSSWLLSYKFQLFSMTKVCLRVCVALFLVFLAWSFSLYEFCVWLGWGFFLIRLIVFGRAIASSYQSTVFTFDFRQIDSKVVLVAHTGYATEWLSL